MVNAIAKQTVHDGHRNLVVKVTIVGDASGDETGTDLIDVADYSDPDSHWDELKLMKVESHLNGFSAQLLWEATTDVKICDLPDGEAIMDWRTIGGLINNAGAGVTGDIQISTVNLGAENGTIVLHMVKRSG